MRVSSKERFVGIFATFWRAFKNAEEKLDVSALGFALEVVGVIVGRTFSFKGLRVGVATLTGDDPHPEMGVAERREGVEIRGM